MLAKLTPAAAATLAFALAVLSSSPALSQARMPTHVACVGDSITAGAGLVGEQPDVSRRPADDAGQRGAGEELRQLGLDDAVRGRQALPEPGRIHGGDHVRVGRGASAVVDVIIMLGTNDTKSYNWTASGGGRARSNTRPTTGR